MYFNLSSQEDADSLTREYLKHRELRGKMLPNGSVSHGSLKVDSKSLNERSEIFSCILITH